MQGQVVNSRRTVAPPNITTTPSPVVGAQVRQDSADPTVNRSGIRDDGINLANFFNRGLPSVGNPGAPSNFTSAVGLTRTSLLQRTSGVTANFADNLGPQPAINLEAGINISPSSLQSFANDAQAAAVGIAGQVMNQVGGIQDAARNLATEMINQLPAISESLTQNVDELGANFASSVGNAEGTIQALQNTITTDPTGIAARIGIDPSRISGLSPQLASKVTEEFSKVAELVPPNANLAGLERAGVVFANMAGTALANLPPLQPASVAPRPIFDPARVAVTDEFGNVIPILNGQANLAALTERNNVRNALGQVSAGISDRFGSAAQVMLDKVGTVQLSVNDISAFSFGVPNPVGSINQNSVANPTPAAVGLGSVESNSRRVDALVQATANVRNSQVNLTLAVQVGSRQTVSPLTSLVNNSNSRGTLV